jgi:hypothetical protein
MKEILFLCLMAGAAAAPAADVAHLRCEDLADPLGIDTTPRD